MTAWHERTIEERNLLNPAFCSVVLWALARGYKVEADDLVESPLLPMAMTFVGLSFVLRGQTRQALPGSVRTSLPTWIYNNPMERSAVAKGGDVLRPYAREAIIFGVQGGLLELAGSSIAANEAAKARIMQYLKQATPEVRDCAKKAEFVGRWLIKSGTPLTIFALLGIQP